MLWEYLILLCKCGVRTIVKGYLSLLSNSFVLNLLFSMINGRSKNDT